jgi:hypothetical protein
MQEEQKPRQIRGFACISIKRRREIAAMGGTRTARKHGKRYMSRIGKAGRAKRTLAERKARTNAALRTWMNERLSKMPDVASWIL